MLLGCLLLLSDKAQAMILCLASCATPLCSSTSSHGFCLPLMCLTAADGFQDSISTKIPFQARSHFKQDLLSTCLKKGRLRRLLGVPPSWKLQLSALPLVKHLPGLLQPPLLLLLVVHHQLLRQLLWQRQRQPQAMGLLQIQARARQRRLRVYRSEKTVK